MTSVGSAPKQSNGHFIILSSLCAPSAAGLGGLLNYSGGTGAGASFTPGNFTVAPMASGNAVGQTGAAPAASLLAPYNLLKDLGQTVISANRLFRKVAAVRPGATANPYAGDTTVSFGVSTTAGVTNDPTYVLGWIELGYEGFGVAAPVARFNNL